MIFRIHYDHFEYLIIFFDLYNTFAIFQCYINDILHDFLDEFYVTYLNDVLIYTDETHENHVKHVYRVFQHFLDHGLYIKPEKCEFHVQETRFLGFVISSSGIAMDPERISTIVDWPTPNSVHDIRVFLGFCNFYRRFIDSYSREVLAMTILLHKISYTFQWTPET